MSRHGSKVEREFPKLSPGQAAIVLVDRMRGCVLRLNGEIFMGEPERIHVVCDSVDQARKEASRIASSMAHVVCVIHDASGKELEYVGL